jgi:hypothetical protein
VDLLDDRVGAVAGLGLEHRVRRVGEHGVMAVDGEQLVLLTGRSVLTVNGCGVEALDPPHDQAGTEMLARCGGVR